VRRGSVEQRPGEGSSLARLAPAAIIVSGPPGSGKTTLATALASALHYAIMDLDTVTGPLTRTALHAAAGDETAIDSPTAVALRAPRYDTLLQVAAANLAVGIGVVIAAPFTAERSSPARFEEVVRRLRSDVALLYIQAPDDVVHSRLQRRNAARDRAKLSRGPAETRPAPLVADAIVIDGTLGDAEQAAAALDALARRADRRPTRDQAPSC
jgi:predicted kinase